MRITQRIRKSKLTKAIAAFLAVLMLEPITGYKGLMAASGGPTQPEFSSFTAVGASDLVDPFTGNVGYSVPLFDIGGYPVTLSYTGDLHSEQDAGWVGLGWSLNLGSINRALRGVPDDFNGDEYTITEKAKPRVTMKVDLSKLKAELTMMNKKNAQSKTPLGKGLDLVTDSKLTKLNYSYQSTKFQFYNDNYSGLILGFGTQSGSITDEYGISNSVLSKANSPGAIRAQIKATVETSVSDAEIDDYTDEIEDEITNAKFSKTTMNAESGFSFNSSGSLSVVNGLNDRMNKYMNNHKSWKQIGMIASGLYNLPSGQISNGLLTGITNNRINAPYTPNFLFVGTPHYPAQNINNRQYSVAVDLSKSKIANKRKFSVNVEVSTSNLQNNGNPVNRPAYGYISTPTASDMPSYIKGPITDIQEHGNTVDRYSRELNTASVNYDIFNISAAGVGGSFRAHQNNLILLGPAPVKRTAVAGVAAKVEFGKGVAAMELGADVGVTINHTRYEPLKDGETGKGDFTEQNLAKNLGLKANSVNSNWENMSLKNDFEFIENQKSYSDQLLGTSAAAFKLQPKQSFRIQNRIINRIASVNGFDGDEITSAIVKPTRDARQQVITYMSAEEAQYKSFQKKIEVYLSDDGTPQFSSNAGYRPSKIELDRVSDKRKKYHISEITVLQPDGTRYYFGTPVYNTIQAEYYYNVGQNLFNNQMNISGNTPNTYNYLNGTANVVNRDISNNSKGIDEYSMVRKMPAYATTYLLNSVLSSDYVDKTGDGPSEDDLGNYVKFNYWQSTLDVTTNEQGTTTAYNPFKWRSRFTGIDLDPGVKTDDQDDKGSFTYGEKELWYIHSIETKDQIAVFYLKKRWDGNGIKEEISGGISTGGPRQYYLDKVAVFSKEEFKKNGTAATPLKVVHLQYDYSLCKKYDYNNVTQNGVVLNDGDDIPSGDSKLGKLTLKKVWFTYGKLGVPSSAPYEFDYNATDINHNPDYAYKSFDRWGTYMPLATGNSTLLNSYNHIDYPYTKQDNKTNADRYASAWMLTSIKLPSGGKIQIDYESDDYAYVQTKQAMQMIKISGLSDRNQATPEKGETDELYKGGITRLGEKNLRDYIFFDRPAGVNSVNDMLKEGELLYYNFAVRIPSTTHPYQKDMDVYEPVTGYMEVKEKGDIGSKSWIRVHHEYAGIFRVNPVFRMAMQQGMQKCPWIFSPATQTKRFADGDPMAFVVNALEAIPDALAKVTNKVKYFQMRNYCRKLDLNRCFIRLTKSDGHKFGGGHRVKSVTISDNWAAMSSEQESSYTLNYSYNKYDDLLDKEISSGVASYEPFVGGDENPNRVPKVVTPSNFDSKVLGKKPSAIQKEFKGFSPQTISYDLDPVGEEFYPSAIVGYSRVTIRTSYPDQNIKKHKTGYTVQEFYTAKDFPAKSFRTNLERRQTRFTGPNLNANKWFRRGMEPSNDKAEEYNVVKIGKMNWTMDIEANLGYTLASQGFSIETNDMHGKPKSNLVFTEDAQTPFSGSEYVYKTDQDGDLTNYVDVIRENGTAQTVEAGLEIEPVLFGSQVTNTSHQIHPDFDYDQKGTIPPAMLVTLGYALNKSTSKIITLTKHVRRMGLIDHVKVYDKGSAMTTKNLAWDAQTGQVLLTSYVNEFGDNIYNFTKPAHWMYEGLTGAYKTVGMPVDLSISSGSATDNSKLLIVGDELIYRDATNTSPNHYWVLDVSVNPTTDAHTISLIDKDGNRVSNGSHALKIYRSGRKNILGLGAETLTLTVNPLTQTSQTTLTDFSNKQQTLRNYKVQVDPASVISAKGITYNDKRQLFEKYSFCWNPYCSYNNTSSEPAPNMETMLPSSAEIAQNCLQHRSFDWNNNVLSTNALFYQTDAGGTHLLGEKVNPFNTGIWGVWKPFGDYAYHDKRTGLEQRTQSEGASYDPNNTNIRIDGKIKNYKEFWVKNSGQWTAKTQKDTANPWTWAGTIQYIDERGNPWQTLNALDTPTSALYSYKDRRLTNAMAVNAYSSELVFDGFEEVPNEANINFFCFNGGLHMYPWSNALSYYNTFSKQVWQWPLAQLLIGNGNRVSDQESHTGWKSLQLGKGNNTMRIYPNDPGTMVSNTPFLNEYYL